MTIQGGPYALTPGRPTSIVPPAAGQQTLYKWVVIFNYSSYQLSVANGGDFDWLTPGIAESYELPATGQPAIVTPEVLPGIPVVTTSCFAVFYTADDGPPVGYPLSLPTAPGTTVVTIAGQPINVDVLSEPTSTTTSGFVALSTTPGDSQVIYGGPAIVYGWDLIGESPTGGYGFAFLSDGATTPPSRFSFIGGNTPSGVTNFSPPAQANFGPGHDVGTSIVVVTGNTGSLSAFGCIVRYTPT